MNKVLVFVEDPGVANMVIDFPDFFKELNFKFQIIANNFASDILSKKSIRHIKIVNKKELKNYLKLKEFDIFLVGTSENKNSLALNLIDIAKDKKILSIGLVDMMANYNFRFSGSSSNPLLHKPDKLIVTDENTKLKFINLGFEKENIYTCFHPQEQRIKQLRKTFLKQKIEETKINQRWLFVSESSDVLNPKESFLNKDFTLRGRGKCNWRTGIVLEEILDIIKTFNPKPELVLRMHPKNIKTQFIDWSDEFVFDEIEDPLQSVWQSDVILGMSSNLLVEAMHLSKPVFSVLTRSSEKEWMDELKMDYIYSVFNRKDLNKLLKNIFKKQYPKVNNQTNLKKKKSIMEVLEVLKIIN
tara:strand:- start:223 stop:1293 length:1071 start_codon:yes stop_codon:yes gene_type:complete